jgi:exosortase/archaeosortase family protein
MVFGAGVVLFGAWMVTHWDRLTGDPDALIRFCLGILFAILIILRRKDPERLPFRLPRWIAPLVLAAGLFAALGGIIFNIHIVEWIGILLMLFACSVWVAPVTFGPDLIIAFFVLFWMHPLPGQVFGWMQGAMQRLSVMGSELVLHAANVRVWGDGLVLRTGYQVFMVPESCSGMRTAVTVFLCTLGVGVLLRLKWYETFSFIVLGLVQVLLLNIARISYMVLWAPRMPPEWASTFLHDSLAVFLMGAILLVQLEASWWFWWSRRRQRIKEGIRNRELEAPDKASVVPHSLRRLGLVLLILVALGVFGIGVFGVIYKSRAYHRKEMIREVAKGLMDSDPATADRAIRMALSLVPGDSDLLSMLARTELIRGRFEEGLAIFDQKEAAGEVPGLEEQVLKSWAFMRLERIEEAKVIIEAMPPETDRLPGVAMLRAEFAAMEKRPDDAAKYVVLASRAHQMLGRIRGLFPYLAMHEQWAAIAESDHDQPYVELFQALIAVQAHHRVRDLAGVAQVLSQAVKSWPDDPRFLGDLYRLAQQRQGSEWEDSFERNMLANVGRLTEDRLAILQDYCWRIARPDLAWITFLHLKRRDAGDPALSVSPAQYATQWCMFRRHRVNVEAEDATMRINLLPLLQTFAECAPFSAFCEHIPLLADVGSAADPEFRKRYLERALSELAKREGIEALSTRLMRLYPLALAMADRYDEAHARLDSMLETYPEERDAIFFQHAVFYDQEGKWQQSYESLRQHTVERDFPSLTADLLMIKAMMNLNLGVCAMDLLSQARVSFPGSLRLDLAEAAIWDVFGFKEQALYVMSRTPQGANAPACVGLLHDTGRRNAARTLSEALGIPLPHNELRQRLRPVSAEWSVARRWPSPLDADSRAERIEKLEELVGKPTSPFVKSLLDLEIDWHRASGRRRETADRRLGEGGRSEVGGQRAEGGGQRSDLRPPTSDLRPPLLTRWEAAGRDGREKVGALYRLAMLAAQDEEYAIGAAALSRCLEVMPKSPVLWRAQVAMTEGRSDIVESAYEHCPQDPDIWLAQLVTRARSTVEALSATNPPPSALGPRTSDLRPPPSALRPPSWSWATNMVAEAIESGEFSPGTLVRAGDYLLSRRQPILAKRLAEAAIPVSRGLLSAHVLGLRTALVLGDARWAMACTINGVENAKNPIPFYKTLVDVKAATRKVDSDLLSALEYLQDREADEPRWAETLGRVYFQQGDMRRALSIFGSVIEGDTRGISIQTLILAAEAARRDAKLDRAINILEAAYAMQPERLSVLNNLVYLLAQNDQTLPRARALMPKLLEIGSDSFAVMDTAAVVYLRSGDIENAKVWMEKAMKHLKKDSYSAHEVQLNAAEVLARSGDLKAAREGIDLLRKDATRSDFVDQKARALLRDIDSLER